MGKIKLVAQIGKDKCMECGKCKKCSKINNPKLCSGCGKCLSVCPFDAITLTDRRTEKKSDAPSVSTEFDEVYNSFRHWLWSDIRIPIELKELIINCKPKRSLELGCGLGRFSSFVAKQGITAIGVDFSSVAIEKAKKRVVSDELKPTFVVGDVTRLDMLIEPFDISFDVGCFHCLYENEQQKYISEVARLLKPGAIHLLWALDSTPSDLKFSFEYIANVFGKEFQLASSVLSRRRIISSHWYWLVRK